MKRFAGSTPREDDLLLVNAYLDGELDAAAALAIEQRMADEPALKNECDRLLTLRRLFNEKLSKDTASEALRDRIVGLTGSGEKDGHLTIRRSTSWRQMAEEEDNAKQHLFVIITSSLLFLRKWCINASG